MRQIVLGLGLVVVLFLFLSIVFLVQTKTQHTADAETAPKTLKRVIIYSRHGVRTPSSKLKTVWPEWKEAPMFLTHRGYQLARGMGRYYAAFYKSLLETPTTSSATSSFFHPKIFVESDTKERDDQTSKALLQDIHAPHFMIESKQTHALFYPLHEKPSCVLNTTTALQAVQAYIGQSSIEDFLNTKQFKPELDFLKQLLTPENVLIDDSSTTTISKDAHLKGPASLVNLYSEALVLEDAQGFSSKTLAWGNHLTTTNWDALDEIHATLREIEDRPLYIAQHKGSAIVSRILDIASAPLTSSSSAPMHVLVGHDGDIGSAAALMGLSWHLPGFAANQVPPASALVFEIHEEDKKGTWVEIYLVSQSLDQMRNLQFADTDAGRPLRVPVYIHPSPYKTFAESRSFADLANESNNSISLSDWKANVERSLLSSCR